MTHTDDTTEAIEQRVRTAADATGVGYRVIPVDPELADTANFCAHYGYPLEDSANCILVASKKPQGCYAACIVLATTKLDVNKTVRKHMGVRRLSFAGPEQTREQTGMMIGGVTPFALPEDLPVLVDARVMQRERIILGGGSRSSKFAAPPSILERLPNPLEVVEGLALPTS